MEVIIKKLSLPEDINWYTKNYLYNDQGYTLYQLKKIEEIKKKNRRKMLDISLELISWKFSGLGINWLRPRKGRKPGYFASHVDLRISLNLCYINNLITKDQWISLGGDPNEILFYNGY